MLLSFFTVLIMLFVGYAFLREGIVAAFAMFVSVILSGLIAFNFFEPLANIIEPAFAGMFLAGYEDFLSLVGIYAICLGGLRTVCNMLMPAVVQFPAILQRSGAALFGFGAGYLVTGFMICALQMLPWHESFMYYDPADDSPSEQGMRRFLPPDHVWLAMMYRAGAYGFYNEEDPRFTDPANRFEKYKTFDKYGTFIYRYQHYRRSGDGKEPWPYSGELDTELYKQ